MGGLVWRRLSAKGWSGGGSRRVGLEGVQLEEAVGLGLGWRRVQLVETVRGLVWRRVQLEEAAGYGLGWRRL